MIVYNVEYPRKGRAPVIQELHDGENLLRFGFHSLVLGLLATSHLLKIKQLNNLQLKILEDPNREAVRLTDTRDEMIEIKAGETAELNFKPKILWWEGKPKTVYIKSICVEIGQPKTA